MVETKKQQFMVHIDIGRDNYSQIVDESEVESFRKDYPDIIAHPFVWSDLTTRCPQCEI